MRDYGYSEMLEEAIDRQLAVYRLSDAEDEVSPDDDRSKFPPRQFPDRDGKRIVRRRSRAQIQHLIEISEY